MNVIYGTDRFDLIPFVDILDSDFKTNYMKWMHDQEVTKHNSHGLFPYAQKDREAFYESLRNNKIICWAVMAIGPEVGAYKHIGNISLQSINWINRSAEFAIVIGEKDYWGKGYATEALQILITHGFEKLNLHRIWSGTAATNKGMQKVFNKLGMKNEAKFKDGMFLNGEYVDVVAYAIVKGK